MKHHLEIMLEKYKELFEKEEVKLYFAPGRVNLIGEHTDYNGGYVFPCALEIGTYALVGKRYDQKICLYSLNRKEVGIIEVELNQITYKKEYKWSNYVLGVIDILQKNGFSLTHGFNAVIYGNIPLQSGLSSSASLEVLTGFFLRDMFAFRFDQVELALMSQKAENEFVGVNCGIMDQFIIANSEEKTALLLDTNTLQYEKVPIDFDAYKLIIMNTNKPRELQESKYNERRSECEEALKIFQTKLDVHSLCEIHSDTFEQYQYFITNEKIRKRARHAIYENERTRLAKNALVNKDIFTFGKLMNESHDSLKNDYEVTGIELDTLVSLARSVAGTIGARMTGAGFGGCAIALVHENAIKEFYDVVAKGYQEKVGLEVSFIDGTVGSGPKIISLH